MKTLSGGQKRRLDLGIALVGDPDLVFLDEPTTGFDPAARRSAWDLIRSLRSLGKTILLTTHYLDEAQQLADRVAVIQAGTIVALGHPGRAHRRTRRRPRSASAATASRSSLTTDDPTRALARAHRRGARGGRELEQLEVRRPTLEDVYLDLVGDEDGAE